MVDMDAPADRAEKLKKKLGEQARHAILAFQDVRGARGGVLGEVGKGFYHTCGSPVSIA